MRVLITGGQGQLGRSLQQALADHDVFAPGHQALDVTVASQVQEAVERLRPTVVIHAAAWTDTLGCQADPQRAQTVNAEGTRLLARACQRTNAIMLYVSTNEVFDGQKQEPYKEEEEPHPINAYGDSKLAGERHAQSLLHRYYIIRTAWLYGPGRISFPDKIIQSALTSGSLKAVTDEVASPTSTYDLAQAIAKLILLKPPWGIYHLTNSGSCSRFLWAKKILELAGLGHISVKPVTQDEFASPHRKPPFSVLDTSRATTLGIQLRAWQEALRDYFREVTPTEISSSGPKSYGNQKPS